MFGWSTWGCDGQSWGEVTQTRTRHTHVMLHHYTPSSSIPRGGKFTQTLYLLENNSLHINTHGKEHVKVIGRRFENMYFNIFMFIFVSDGVLKPQAAPVTAIIHNNFLWQRYSASFPAKTDTSMAIAAWQAFYRTSNRI